MAIQGALNDEYYWEKRGYIKIAPAKNARYGCYLDNFNLETAFKTVYSTNNTFHQGTFHYLNIYLKQNEKETTILIYLNDTFNRVAYSEVEAVKKYVMEEIGWKYHNPHIIVYVMTERYGCIRLAKNPNTLVSYCGRLYGKGWMHTWYNRQFYKDYKDLVKYSIYEMTNEFDDDCFEFYGGHRPIVTFILMALMVYAFVRGSSGLLELFPLSLQRFIEGNLYHNNIVDYIWLLICPIFMHANIIHLLGNLSVLFIFGQMLESRIGSKEFSIIFFLSGIMGNLVSLSYNLDNRSYYSETVGASGAILGLLGGLVITGSIDFVKKKILVKHFILYLGVSALYIFLCSFGTNVDNACHIGGFIGGLLVTIIVRCITRMIMYKFYNGDAFRNKIDKENALVHKSNLVKAQIEAEDKIIEEASERRYNKRGTNNKIRF